MQSAIPVLMRWQAMAILAAHSPKLAACAMMALAISSRSGLAFALLWMPAARADGMGKSAAGTTLTRALAGAVLAILGMAVLVGPQAAVLVLATQIVVQTIFARIALRQIGGQSGDVLGAMQQLAEVAGWLVLAR